MTQIAEDRTYESIRIVDQKMRVNIRDGIVKGDNEEHSGNSGFFDNHDAPLSAPTIVSMKKLSVFIESLTSWSSQEFECKQLSIF
jgi:hypothetical protein